MVMDVRESVACATSCGNSCCSSRCFADECACRAADGDWQAGNSRISNQVMMQNTLLQQLLLFYHHHHHHRHDHDHHRHHHLGHYYYNNNYYCYYNYYLPLLQNNRYHLAYALPLLPGCYNIIQYIFCRFFLLLFRFSLSQVVCVLKNVCANECARLSVRTPSQKGKDRERQNKLKKACRLAACLAGRQNQ